MERNSLHPWASVVVWRASLRGLSKPKGEPGYWGQPKRLSVGQRGLRASQTGLRASQRGLRYQ